MQDLATWLNRKPSGKKPKKSLRRSVGVRKVSKKRSRANRIYTIKRKAFLEAHPYCQIFLTRWGKTEVDVAMRYSLFGSESGPGPRICVKFDNRATGGMEGFHDLPVPMATDIHHVKRRGKYFLDESTWLAASRIEHDWAHRNPKEARALGIIQ